MPDNVYRTAVASLVTQVVIAVATAVGFFVRVEDPEDASDLNVILGVEFGSQIIEFLWYLIVVFRYTTIMTWTRYLDWVVSTPIMLASTVLFFAHRTGEDLSTPFSNPLIYVTFVSNWLMLLFGFLAETMRIPRAAGLFIGGIFFVASFVSLATHVDERDALSNGLFWFTYAVWAGYGLAATLSYEGKNIAYNALDVVAKNFYGLFLFIYSLTLT